MATAPDTGLPLPQRIAAITASFALLEGSVDPDALAATVATLEQQMQAPGFWDDSDAAAKVSAEHARATRKLEAFRTLQAEVGDLEGLVELVAEDSDLAA